MARWFDGSRGDMELIIIMVCQLVPLVADSLIAIIDNLDAIVSNRDVIYSKSAMSKLPQPRNECISLELDCEYRMDHVPMFN